MSGSKGELVRQRILNAITYYNSKHDSQPTIMDIKVLTGIRSFNTISRHLNALKRDGLIYWDSGRIAKTTSTVIKC